MNMDSGKFGKTLIIPFQTQGILPKITYLYIHIILWQYTLMV